MKTDEKRSRSQHGKQQHFYHKRNESQKSTQSHHDSHKENNTNKQENKNSK